jgi:hypothetical protein
MIATVTIHVIREHEPMEWMIARHVKNEKADLNFSELERILKESRQ